MSIVVAEHVMGLAGVFRVSGVVVASHHRPSAIDYSEVVSFIFVHSGSHFKAVEAVPTAVRSFSEVSDRSVVYKVLSHHRTALRTHFAPSSLLHRRRLLSCCPYDHSSTLCILPASTYAYFLPPASLATFYTLTVFI